MPSQPPPKVCLFDIGGVCVNSPFQAILDYETAHGITKGWINYAISTKKPNGSWHKIERGEVPLDDAWYAEFKRDIQDPRSWKAYHAGLFGDGVEIPPTPVIDAKELFLEMMRRARTLDIYMYPALTKLKESGKFILGALSNTVAFPEGHPLAKSTHDGEDLASKFDVFVSSAHVGMRKPDRRVYDYTLKELDRFDRERGGNGVKAEDVVFLDDIGENLKMAKSLGIRTIRVYLGRIRDAVEELEEVTGMSLLEDDGEKAKL